MGHIINPISKRLGFTHYWPAHWSYFKEKNYTYLLLFDLVLINFLIKFFNLKILKNFCFFIDKFYILKFSKKTIIILKLHNKKRFKFFKKYQKTIYSKKVSKTAPILTPAVFTDFNFFGGNFNKLHLSFFTNLYLLKDFCDIKKFCINLKKKYLKNYFFFKYSNHLMLDNSNLLENVTNLYDFINSLKNLNLISNFFFNNTKNNNQLTKLFFVFSNLYFKNSKLDHDINIFFDFKNYFSYDVIKKINLCLNNKKLNPELFLKKKFIEKFFFSFLTFLINIKLKQFNTSSDILFIKNTNRKITSYFVCNFIARNLLIQKKRLRIEFLIKLVIRTLMTFKRIKGFKISITGRFSRKQRAGCYWESRGLVPLNTLNIPIDYFQKFVTTKYGLSCIRVWLYAPYKEYKINNISYF